MDRPEGSYHTGKYTVRVPYKVVVSSIQDGPQIVASAPGLPLIFSQYSFGNERNPYMFLMGFDPKPLGSPPTLTWRVDAVYETLPLKEGREGTRGNASGGGTGRQTPGEFTNPLLELPIVKFHSSGREALLTQVYDTTTGVTKPATASNGEVFDPPPKYLEPYATLEITRNEAIGARQPGIAIQYANTVNSDQFWGATAGYWRCKEIIPERQERQIPGGSFRFPFLRVSYSFEYNPNTWDIQLLDYGSYYWQRARVDQGADGQPNNAAERIQIKTKDGQPTSAPLNGNGYPLPDRAPCRFSGGSSTITLPTTTPIQQFHVGDTVLFSATPIVGGAANAVTAPTGLAFGTAYYVVSTTPANPTATQATTAITVSATRTGAAIVPSDAGSGNFYVYSPGIFFTVRPYTRLAFRALGLPQSFAQVQ